MSSALKPEETRYKAAAVQLLNSALSHSACAKDDSVLAMLLVLCLFHVCDSGFTKFKAQLAGVQKLLNLRDRNVQSKFTGWVDMFFTWFDVMTSTVNDREIQIRGDSLDTLDFPANLGALEHLVGCDGRLFKLIARLGRLNLLSQNRPVRDAGIRSGPRPSPKPKSAKDYYSFQYDRLDGNGWRTPLSSSSEESAADADDPRQDFWPEWHTVRERLQTWQIESPPPSSDAMPAAAAAQDLQHISEAFRYSALLYIERLACPALPPGTPNFQRLVARALYHVGRIAVTSCVNKFLLWPLFIAGTECTDEAHRDMVRRRCVEIQRESGFFNNLSGLEVLERVWREDDGGEGGAGGADGGMWTAGVPVAEGDGQGGWGVHCGLGVVDVIMTDLCEHDFYTKTTNIWQAAQEYKLGTDGRGKGTKMRGGEGEQEEGEGEGGAEGEGEEGGGLAGLWVRGFERGGKGRDGRGRCRGDADGAVVERFGG